MEGIVAPDVEVSSYPAVMVLALAGVEVEPFLVRDLDEAYERIARLGFTVQPKGTHSDHMGTHNHCVMLRQGYFEILAIRMATEANERWRRAVERREGLSAIALATEDARAAYDVFAANGIAGADPVDFARPVELARGSTEARFTVTVIPDEATPGANMFVCQHHTRDAVWVPGSMNHENRAAGLSGVTAVVEEPAAIADAYARVFGAERLEQSGQGLSIDLPGAPIEFLSPAAYADRYAGVPPDPAASAPIIGALSFKSADLGATEACLAGNGVSAYKTPSGGVCVAPPDACGALIEFV